MIQDQALGLRLGKYFIMASYRDNKENELRHVQITCNVMYRHESQESDEQLEDGCSLGNVTLHCISFHARRKLSLSRTKFLGQNQSRDVALWTFKEGADMSINCGVPTAAPAAIHLMHRDKWNFSCLEQPFSSAF